MSDELINNTGKNFIKTMTGAGLLLGAGSASIIGLVNYFRSLNRDKRNTLDNTLYLKLEDKDKPQQQKLANTVQKQTEPAGAIANAIGILGLALAGAGGYAGTRKIINSLREKEVDNDLKRSQNNVLKLQGYQPVKSASEGRPISTSEVVSAFVPLAMLTTAIGAGALTYTSLDKAHPKLKPAVKPPKKIVLVDDDGDDLVEKAANSDGYEFIMNMVYHHPENSLTKNLITAIVTESPQVIKQASKTLGFNGMLATVKGHANQFIPKQQMAASCMFLANDADLYKEARLLAALDFNALYPGAVETAQNMESGNQKVAIEYVKQAMVAIKKDLLGNKYMNKSAEEIIEEYTGNPEDSKKKKELEIIEATSIQRPNTSAWRKLVTSVIKANPIPN